MVVSNHEQADIAAFRIMLENLTSLGEYALNLRRDMYPARQFPSNWPAQELMFTHQRGGVPGTCLKGCWVVFGVNSRQNL